MNGREAGERGETILWRATIDGVEARDLVEIPYMHWYRDMTDRVFPFKTITLSPVPLRRDLFLINYKIPVGDHPWAMEWNTYRTFDYGDYINTLTKMITEQSEVRARVVAAHARK